MPGKQQLIHAPRLARIRSGTEDIIPRVVEEHDSFSGIISAVEAGTGVTIGADVFGHSFGNRVKLLHITREPKPISVGIVALKGRLSPAAEKFWQCAKQAASAK